MNVAHIMLRPWYVASRTRLVAQAGDQPNGLADYIFGLVEEPEVAQHICDEHNRALDRS